MPSAATQWYRSKPKNVCSASKYRLPISTARRQEHEIRALAKANKACFICAERDAVEADLLNVELQKRGESQVPEGRGDDDKVGICKLLCVPKARMRQIARFQKTLPLV